MRRTRQKSAPPKPSAGAVEALGPYARTRLTVRALGLALPLDVPADVFATRAIDDGTLLLLRNLPERAPGSLLDLGAVRAAAQNARSLRLSNVEARPGLGYRDLSPGARFDLVLCNVPARIGPRGVAYLLDAGRSLLTREGELRAVVIRDLREQVETAQLPGMRLAAQGRNHLVYSVP